MKAILPLLFISITALLSCKKDKIEPNNPPPSIPSDYSHMEGNFLCDVDELYAYDPGYTAQSDKVINLHVSNDTLFVLNEFFVINSENQTEFTKTVDYILVIVTVSLTFENNYNDVIIDVHTDGSPSSGPDRDYNYTGSRTLLPVSGTQHIDEQLMNGLYALTVTELDTYSNIDTSYIDTISVSYSNNNFHFDSDQYHAPNFRHTFVNQTNWNNSMYETKKMNVFWDRTDSLYVFNETIVEDLFGLNADTVMIEYSGRHL